MAQWVNEPRLHGLWATSWENLPIIKKQSSRLASEQKLCKIHPGPTYSLYSWAVQFNSSNLTESQTQRTGFLVMAFTSVRFEHKIVNTFLPISFNMFWVLKKNIERNKKDCSRWYTIVNTRFLPLVFTMGQGYMKCCPIPSKECDQCTCKVWSCYVQQLIGEDAFARKYSIWPWTWQQGHEILPSTLYIMWPMQLLSLKLLLQENIVFVLWPWNMKYHIAKYPRHLCTYKVLSCYV